MITIQPAPDECQQRVAAEPFRAHLKFLINSGSVSAEVIAEFADLTIDQLGPLLRPNPGGGDRIAADVARRLIMISASMVRATRYELVPAAPVRAALHRLRAAGWNLDRLTDYLRMRRPTVQLLLSGRTLSCTRLTQLRVAAAVRPLTEDSARPAKATPPPTRPTAESVRAGVRPALPPVA